MRDGKRINIPVVGREGGRDSAESKGMYGAITICWKRIYKENNKSSLGKKEKEVPELIMNFSRDL